MLLYNISKINLLSKLKVDFIITKKFDKLNENEGLGGIRILNNIKKIKKFFKNNKKI